MQSKRKSSVLIFLVGGILGCTTVQKIPMTVEEAAQVSSSKAGAWVQQGTIFAVLGNSSGGDAAVANATAQFGMVGAFAGALGTAIAHAIATGVVNKRIEPLAKTLKEVPVQKHLREQLSKDLTQVTWLKSKTINGHQYKELEEIIKEANEDGILDVRLVYYSDTWVKNIIMQVDVSYYAKSEKMLQVYEKIRQLNPKAETRESKTSIGENDFPVLYRNWFYYVETLPPSVLKAHPDMKPVDLWARDNGKIAKEVLMRGVREISQLIAADLNQLAAANKKFSQTDAKFPETGLRQYDAGHKKFSGKVLRSSAHRMLLEQKEGSFASVPTEDFIKPDSDSGSGTGTKVSSLGE